MTVFALVVALVALVVSLATLILQAQEARARGLLVTARLADEGDEVRLRIDAFDTGPAPVTVLAAWLWVSTDRRPGPDTALPPGVMPHPRPVQELWEISGTLLDVGDPALPAKVDGRSWRTWSLHPAPDIAVTAQAVGNARTFVVVHLAGGRIVTAQLTASAAPLDSDP